MLEVHTKGFAQLQEGRSKWSFVRELVSNALDEKISTCTVDIKKEGRNPAVITVEDDGAGFRDLRDAYTLFAPTPKRGNPDVRGRFNLGEKELASIAKEMVIESTKGGVKFKDGKRSRINKKREVGTLVTVVVNWSFSDLSEIDKMIRMVIPPTGVSLKYNRQLTTNEIEQPMIIGFASETLPTTLFTDGAIRPTKRKTAVGLYALRHEQESGWLFELGIPIQEIECPYNVDVRQKVPMSPNRDTVSDNYLKAIYAIVLNETAKDLTEETVSDSWVHQGSELADDEAIKEIHDTRYEDAVLWSSDQDANERALMDGKDIVHGRTLSGIERDRFRSAGLVSAKVGYGRGVKDVDRKPRDKWTEGMKSLETYTQWISEKLEGYKVSVNYISDIDISAVATYGGRSITYNLFRLGKQKTVAPYYADITGLILHELAHENGGNKMPHFSMDYIHKLQDLSGRLALIVAKNPEEFEAVRNPY